MYFCMKCESYYTEDDMVIYQFNTRRGFCRDCANNTDLHQREEIRKIFNDGGKQLSFTEVLFSPTPY